jgi:hypothetical protein
VVEELEIALSGRRWAFLFFWNIRLVRVTVAEFALGFGEILGSDMVES